MVDIFHLTAITWQYHYLDKVDGKRKMKTPPKEVKKKIQEVGAVLTLTEGKEDDTRTGDQAVLTEGREDDNGARTNGNDAGAVLMEERKMM